MTRQSIKLGENDEWEQRTLRKEVVRVGLESYSRVRRSQTTEVSQIRALPIRNFNSHNIAERLGLVNGYFRFFTTSSYDINKLGVSSPYLLAGYLGMFISMAILPIPDYILVPVYGYLSSIGIFNPFATFLVCLVAALFPIEYVCGRFAGRPLLLKGLSYFRITEKDIEVADKWLVEHGKFSIFISTFIPFFYSVTSLAAGTLKMKAAPFFLYSTVGFGLRYVFLEYIGYFGIYIFTASFDYSERTLFSLLLILSSVYAALYLTGTFRSKRLRSRYGSIFH